MKILAINTESGWRGGERQTYYHIKGFLEQSVTIEVLCRQEEPLSKALKGMPVTQHTVSGSYEAWRFLCQHGHEYDLLHAHTAKAQSLVFLSKWKHQKPMCYTRRVDFVPSGWFAKKKYANTEQVVALSQAIQEMVQPLCKHRVPVIHSMVEEKLRNPERAKLFYQNPRWQGKKILATTSALVPHKDPLNMVEAIHQLRQSRQDFVFLHFGGGELEGAVQESIAEHDLGDYYQLMGFVDSVEELFEGFDLFVMSSQEEGLGSSVLDAFVYQVPVVSTDAGGLAEIVTNHGLVCPKQNPEALAEAMEYSLSHPEEQALLVEKAYCYAKEEHSIEAITQKYRVLFQNLCPYK